MPAVKYKWDAKAINEWTNRAQRRIRSAKEFVEAVETDPNKEQRFKNLLCVVCYNTTQICGQGFTAATCQSCESSFMWPNTCVPKLCTQCAQNLDACQKCGADINLEKRK